MQADITNAEFSIRLDPAWFGPLITQVDTEGHYWTLTFQDKQGGVGFTIQLSAQQMADHRAILNNLIIPAEAGINPVRVQENLPPLTPEQMMELHNTRIRGAITLQAPAVGKGAEPITAKGGFRAPIHPTYAQVLTERNAPPSPPHRLLLKQLGGHVAHVCLVPADSLNYERGARLGRNWHELRVKDASIEPICGTQPGNNLTRIVVDNIDAMEVCRECCNVLGRKRYEVRDDLCAHAQTVYEMYLQGRHP